MTLRTASAGLFVVGVAVGTLADRTPPKAPLVRGGYQVLAVDLHVHSFLGDGVLLPWDLAREAGRRGLDAFAITNHSQVLVAKVGRWLSRFTGGPTILVGEEVTAPGYHLIAVGIEEKVSWRQPVARAIEDVHAQGGVAIAAHPLARFWPAFDAAALRSLDGAEVMHPVAYSGPEKAEELRAFYRSGDAGGRGLAPIGSSDHHVLNGLGLCRTYVFARDRSAAAIVDAVRDHRTVVYDPEGKAYGDPALVELLKDVATTLGPGDYGRLPDASGLEWITRTAAWFGLLGLVFFVGSGAPESGAVDSP